MPRDVKIITVFVASPGDVSAERTSLERVVRELNLMWSPFNVQLDLVRWETHVHPAAGADVQDVINTQIQDDYDVFLGIFWSRIGTPTPRAESGTVEEFERAFARAKASPGSPEMMIYLKDEPVPPSQIEPAQLAGLQVFSRSLSNRGVLYSSFKSVGQFEELARIHLAQVLTRFGRDMAAEAGNSASRDDVAPSLESTSRDNEFDDPDLGLLDLEEIFHASVQRMIAAAGEIQGATEQLTEDMEKRVGALERASDTAERKTVVENSAVDIVRYAEKIEKTVPELRDAQQRMSIAGVRRVAFENAPMLANADRDEFVQTLEGLVTTYKDVHFKMKAMRDVIADLPRATATLNRAKRRTVSALDSLLDFFITGERLILSIQSALPPAAKN